MTLSSLEERVERVQGPILVLGASGFIGANLLRLLLRFRTDVFGAARSLPAWRLEGISEKNLVEADLLVDSSLDALLDRTVPRTVFNCVAYGAYSFEREPGLIYETNFNLTARLLARLLPRKISCYVHSGSSSEYGDRAGGPTEDDRPEPNSDYAVSKAACSSLISFYGKKKGLPCANLRLYSAYGPMEDSSRLVPNVVRAGIERCYPPFVNPEISRDFVYVEDLCEAYVDTALALKRELYGESFNIGSGRRTRIADVAAASAEIFSIPGRPVYGSMEMREWDVNNWFSEQTKTERLIGWKARTPFREGLKLTAEWYKQLDDKERYHASSKRFALDTKHSVSAVIACYKDGQAIPIMYERLKKTFEKLRIDYEVIFVNDNSPDDSEEVIRRISQTDRKVIGISHSRNFGSQSAFRSGMELASKNAVVLLDGDLQDPPEIIEQFVAKWTEGYEVVYGRRLKRVAPFFMQVAYRLFYWLFDAFSYLRIPRDAGDFSLIDIKVVRSMLQCPERNLFLRGVRAFVGFKQTGVDYVRPERMFGKTTNSLLKNIGWAKKGILSYSYTPLSMLSFAGTLLLFVTVAAAAVQIFLRIQYPHLAPKGITTILLVVAFFGSANLFAKAVLGEYLAKVFEEVKQRPHFIRRHIIRNGEIRSALDVR